MRSGFRIVKGRTERQREATADYAQRPDSVVSIQRGDAGLPTSSWWTEPVSRAEFDRRHMDEQRRMALSRWGRTVHSIILE